MVDAMVEEFGFTSITTLWGARVHPSPTVFCPYFGVGTTGNVIHISLLLSVSCDALASALHELVGVLVDFSPGSVAAKNRRVLRLGFVWVLENVAAPLPWDDSVLRPSRLWRGARVHGLMTTAIHDHEHAPRSVCFLLLFFFATMLETLRLLFLFFYLSFFNVSSFPFFSFFPHFIFPTAASIPVPRRKRTYVLYQYV